MTAWLKAISLWETRADSESWCRHFSRRIAWALHRSRSRLQQARDDCLSPWRGRRWHRSGWSSRVALFCSRLRAEQTRPRRTSWASTDSACVVGAIGGPRQHLRWTPPSRGRRQPRISRSSSSGFSPTMIAAALRRSSRPSRSPGSSRWHVNLPQIARFPYRTGPRQSWRARPSSAASSKAFLHDRSTVF